MVFSYVVSKKRKSATIKFNEDWNHLRLWYERKLSARTKFGVDNSEVSSSLCRLASEGIFRWSNQLQKFCLIYLRHVCSD